MHRVLEKAYRGITRVLPAELAGRVDRFRPAFSASWGGPLNGQQHRRQMVRDIAQVLKFDRVLETGTYRGTSTEFFAAVFGCPIETVEGNRRLHEYSTRRLEHDPTISIELGDSRDFLSNAGARERAGSETVFFYLDAHWEEDLPLAEELDIISQAWTRAVVMIDDFEVPGDDGYAFDDYGPAKRLTEGYLPPSVAEWTRLYPSVPSTGETGAKRGSVVLVSPALHVDAPSLETRS